MTSNPNEDRPNSQVPARVRERNLTPAGRASRAQNATRHGALSTQIVSSREDVTQFEALLAELVREFDPETAIEFSLIQRLATLFWRERRLTSFETAVLKENEIEPTFGPKTKYDINFQLLVGRYQTMLSNQVKKTLEELRRLKMDKES